MAARASGSRRPKAGSRAARSTAATADDFHVVTGGRAWIAIPRAGFPLGRALDSFLAFVVRRFPLTVQPPTVVEPESVTGYDDALGKAHRALHSFLCERGWRVPKPIRDAHARAVAITPWPLSSVLAGDAKRRVLARVDELERELKVLRNLLGKYRPPSSRDVFGSDAAARARLDELVLDLIREAVAAPSPRRSRVPRGRRRRR